ncbi:unnamed protein product [marine sediment metagenome]|uniref:Uncharacterized protein n=1 Tax=marine sediment metagenome TaxID=412755 RepID=X0X5D9_9ZZZZ
MDCENLSTATGILDEALDQAVHDGSKLLIQHKLESVKNFINVFMTENNIAQQAAVRAQKGAPQIKPDCVGCKYFYGYKNQCFACSSHSHYEPA